MPFQKLHPATPPRGMCGSFFPPRNATLLVISIESPLECRCPRLRQDYPTIWSNYTQQTHTHTHSNQTSTHMHKHRHTLNLSFKHTRPCKVLLSAEERSRASFALAPCSQHVQRCLSLAGSPTGQSDAQRDRRGGGCVHRLQMEDAHKGRRDLLRPLIVKAS